MQEYDLSQWVLFFFLYSFLGWIWESCYVSVRKHRWVNRGFMHGPMLPLYGSGAMVVLIVTIPVRDNPACLSYGNDRCDNPGVFYRNYDGASVPRKVLGL